MRYWVIYSISMSDSSDEEVVVTKKNQRVMNGNARINLVFRRWLKRIVMWRTLSNQNRVRRYDNFRLVKWKWIYDLQSEGESSSNSEDESSSSSSSDESEDEKPVRRSQRNKSPKRPPPKKRKSSPKRGKISLKELQAIYSNLQLPQRRLQHLSRRNNKRKKTHQSEDELDLG